MAEPARTTKNPGKGRKAEKRSSVSGRTDAKSKADYILGTYGSYVNVTSWSASAYQGILTVAATVQVLQDPSNIQVLQVELRPSESQPGSFIASSSIGGVGDDGLTTATLYVTGGPVDFVPTQIASRISGTVMTAQGEKPIGPQQYANGYYYYFYYQSMLVNP